MVDQLTKGAVMYEANKSIHPEATVLTDGASRFKCLSKVINTHLSIQCYNRSIVSEVFPWVHIAIGNARKIITGIHHGVKSKYFQNYLNEFCYKFNRRQFQENLFGRLVVASVNTTWYCNRYLSG